MNDIATPTELDILVAKIEKLWRKAGDNGATDAEREAFEAKALSLMERYRIDKAMLDLTGDDPLDDHLFGYIKGRYGRTYLSLIGEVARAYDCRVWWRHHRMDYTAYLFGFKSDAERVKRIANLLLLDATTQAGKVTRGSKGATLNWRRSFIMGYTAAVSVRFREASLIAREDAIAESGETAVTSAALVLVDRSNQVEKAYKAKGLRSAPVTSAATSGGYSAGVEAGRNADLSGGSNRVGGGVRALTT